MRQSSEIGRQRARIVRSAGSMMRCRDKVQRGVALRSEIRSAYPAAEFEMDARTPVSVAVALTDSRDEIADAAEALAEAAADA